MSWVEHVWTLGVWAPDGWPTGSAASMLVHMQRNGSHDRSPALSGALVDRATQRWVIATGRRVTFEDHWWLDGPVGAPVGIGEEWITQHAQRTNAQLIEGGGGLLPDMAALNGHGFDAAAIHPRIRAFYETTAEWELDVWSRWTWWAEPGGRLINAVFARRLRQLSLPVDPLDTSDGMDSRVLRFATPAGQHLGTAWQRTLRRTGTTLFGGFYGVVTVPLGTRPSVRVVFPLPNGSLTVFLQPHVHGPHGLRLVSPAGRFGAEGAYLVVRPTAGATGWARRVPLPETFILDVDAAADVRCDHRLSLGGAEMLRLRYRAHQRLPSTPVHTA